MKFHEQNPNFSFTQQANMDTHIWFRQNFASRFAQNGGVVSAMFAPSGSDAFLAAMRSPHKYGSESHLRNLDMLQAHYEKGSPEFQKLEKVRNKVITSSKGPRGMLSRAGKLAGPMLGAGMVALPAILTPGGPAERARAAAGGLAANLGWVAGGKLGAGIGAAIGSAVPGVGTVIGGAAGFVVGAFGGAIGMDTATQWALRLPDRLVDRERARRRLDWVGDKQAFQTERAHTMRARSLEMMNRGMMSGRSLLGRESIMLHQ